MAAFDDRLSLFAGIGRRGAAMLSNRTKAAASGMKIAGMAGFTLIELMVAVAILAVLVSLAAPSYHRLVIDSRMTAQANDFLTALHFTRSEAVKRYATVTMCKSSDGACCATSGTWAQGWIVFVDKGTTCPRDVDPNDLLRVHAALTDGSTLVGTGANNLANRVTYRPNGVTPQSGQFDLCSSDTSLPGRDITLSIGTGIPRSAVDGPMPTCG
jgi:type IV fimbrial biogenesis protein FimT